ncbi:uncharacterized protein LOC133203474 [Saccostrea echinata]|uniref:uncharacterized protein LOC133203474 n=1 Tax=Saccostrea echinata TaxID=191078 RepID=UPI002A8315D0|nr:uncharacterized protein LOC133203474 [Saccostrea echinata]
MKVKEHSSLLDHLSSKITLSGTTLAVLTILVCILLRCYTTKKKQDDRRGNTKQHRASKYFLTVFSLFPVPINLPTTLKSILIPQTYRSVLELDITEETDSKTGKPVCRFCIKK